ncbi:MAG TPA: serine hydrolase domain-containing protein [Chloroflexia bacterium]|nr:serine hydrolase domain-containing protein [Chloroflexia bacterium]
MDWLNRVKLPPEVPGLSIAVMDDGQISYAQGFGVCEAGQPAPVTTETLLQACSVSKAVTALGVLRLVEMKELHLDQEIDRTHHHWSRLQGSIPLRGITLRRLLSHTAGVNLPWSAGYHPEEDIPTLDEVLNGDKPSLYPAIEVTSPPGRGFNYSAGGYCVIQKVMEHTIGMPFPELMRGVVLDPLKMEHSTFEQPLPREWQALAAIGHRATGRPLGGKWRVYPEMAAAGLWTTPSDLALLALDLQNALSGHDGTLLTQETARLMVTPVADAGERGKVGLGVFIEGEGPGARFGHPGDNEGYTAAWSSLLEGDKGAVIMTNSDAGWLSQSDILGEVARTRNWPGYPND